MNRHTINNMRSTMGLMELPGDPNKVLKKKRQAGNKAARAQASRDLRSLRSGFGKKGK